ncbi:unnamed protein product [Trichogramma brassicae]|uniref:C2H2-type domain-containing protein n=1 Tax=Trichogramma brassicae TaxID=86971 RepID=A0A6H5HYR1_9HYME|nr:unnamed protein product [Trichogramma brassicae]
MLVQARVFFFIYIGLRLLYINRRYRVSSWRARGGDASLSECTCTMNDRPIRGRIGLESVTCSAHGVRQMNCERSMLSRSRLLRYANTMFWPPVATSYRGRVNSKTRSVSYTVNSAHGDLASGLSSIGGSGLSQKPGGQLVLPFIELHLHVWPHPSMYSTPRGQCLVAIPEEERVLIGTNTPLYIAKYDEETEKVKYRAYHYPREYEEDCSVLFCARRNAEIDYEAEEAKVIDPPLDGTSCGCGKVHLKKIFRRFLAESSETEEQTDLLEKSSQVNPIAETNEFNYSLYLQEPEDERVLIGTNTPLYIAKYDEETEKVKYRAYHYVGHDGEKECPESSNIMGNPKGKSAFAWSECSLQNFKKHLKTIHDGHKDYACDKCDKKFGRQSNFLRHQKAVHGGRKDYACDKCEKKFGRKDHWLFHQKTVHEIRRYFECDKCEKKFVHKQYLFLHQKTVHEGRKDHSCDKCEKKFGRKWDLLLHTRTVHEGRKDFACDKCDKKFVLRSNLLLHQKLVHEGRKDHSCDKCEKKFGRKWDLLFHQRTVHEGRKDFTCDKCFKFLKL